MLNAKRQTICVPMMQLFAILLPVIMDAVTGAPQAKELYARDEEATLDRVEQTSEERQLLYKELQTAIEIIAKLEDGDQQIRQVKKLEEVNQKVELPIQINEVKNKDVAIQPPHINKCVEGKHHIQIREAIDKPEDATSTNQANLCSSEIEHKIKSRQTEVNESEPTQPESDFPTDDLVTSLIRQRNDFIAAAGVAEAPRPVQAMRLNMNSGL